MSEFLERREAIKLIAGDMIDDLFPALARYDSFYGSKNRRLQDGRHVARAIVPGDLNAEVSQFGSYDDPSLLDDTHRLELYEQIEDLGMTVARYALEKACRSALTVRNRNRHLTKEVFTTAYDKPTTAMGYVEDTWAPIYAYSFVEAASDGMGAIK